MIYITSRGESFDTERDFTDAERHILQKLFIWQELADSPAEFRQKKAEALGAGWNNSGPLSESLAMRRITKDLEAKIGRPQTAKKPPSP